MPLTIIPMAINLMTGFALWQTELSTTAKIIITIFIVLKFATYFYSALMADACSAPRYIGLGICALINIGLLIYTLVASLWTVATGVAMCLILLIIWSSIAVFSFGKKDGNEQ